MMNKKTKTLVLAVIAFAPTMMSICYSTADATPVSVSRRTDRPGLAFDQYLVHFAKIQPTHTVSARYSFKNTSNVAITIEELKPSCGCLQPRLKSDKHTYQPGEQGEFYMRVETDKEPVGMREYYCDVVYEDTKPRETRVTFKVNLPEKKVTVTPKSLIFFQPNEQRTTHELKLDNYTDKRLDILGVECSNKLAQVAIGEAEFDKQGKRLQKVLVSVAKVPAGRHMGNVTIYTTHPIYKKIVVPIRIDGPIEAGEL